VRDALPAEADLELDYERLIEMLLVLVGEEVCLSISSGDRGGARLQLQGVLRHYDYASAEGFAVGDAGRLLVDRNDFTRAHLRTFEGTTFFLLSVELGQMSLAIGDPDLLGTDEFDPAPSAA
jgi:hypothetical protein